jgi:hypothetical protein
VSFDLNHCELCKPIDPKSNAAIRLKLPEIFVPDQVDKVVNSMRADRSLRPVNHMRQINQAGRDEGLIGQHDVLPRSLTARIVAEARKSSGL